MSGGASTPAHRAPYKLDALDANTWRAGLDRLLLGVAMADEGHRLVGGVLPVDDVSSSDIDLAGRLAELLDRLTAALDTLSARPAGRRLGRRAGRRRRPAHRHQPDRRLADRRAAPPPRRRRRRSPRRAHPGTRPPPADLTADGRHRSRSRTSATGPELTLPEIRTLLADRLRGHPTRANFRTGHLTVCTLVPMRSVPHRVVCLLGLDDGVFPRKVDVDDDDLVAADARVGDRDPRSEDRQLLLDALLAAESHLIVTYSGRDERTNAERPPAVPIGELLDVVDRTVRLPDDPTGDGAAPARRIVVHHPLQPFDARNFMAGRLAGRGAVELRRRGPGRRPGGRRGPRRPGAVPARAAPAAAGPTPSSSSTSSSSCSTPSRRSSASGSGSP